MNWLTQLGTSVGAFIIAILLLWAWFKWRGLNWGEMLQTEPVAQMSKRLAAQEVRLAAQDEKIAEQDRQIRDLINELLNEKRKTDLLEQRIADMERDAGPRFRVGMNVLGVWPRAPHDPQLNLEGSRDAIYNAGFDHTALFGDMATRKNIVENIARPEVSILEIGGHGTEDGTPLADGLARPGWWENLLRDRRNIKIVLFLTCFSSQSMYEAVNRAGVPHIILASGELSDAAAVGFARAFYSNYANGKTVAQSVREAKLLLDYTEAEKIKLAKTTEGQ